MASKVTQSSPSLPLWSPSPTTLNLAYSTPVTLPPLMFPEYTDMCPHLRAFALFTLCTWNSVPHYINMALASSRFWSADTFSLRPSLNILFKISHLFSTFPLYFFSTAIVFQYILYLLIYFCLPYYNLSPLDEGIFDCFVYWCILNIWNRVWYLVGTQYIVF